MKLNKFALSVLASISMVSASSYALTSEEVATILAGFESSVSTISSPEALVSQVSQLVAQYPSLVESIIQIAIAQEPSATLSIVQSVSEQLQLAVMSGQITTEQADLILDNAESTAQQTAAANGVSITPAEVTIATNAGALDALNNDALNNVEPTAADANTQTPDNTPSVNTINRANRGSAVSPS